MRVAGVLGLTPEGRRAAKCLAREMGLPHLDDPPAELVGGAETVRRAAPGRMAQAGGEAGQAFLVFDEKGLGLRLAGSEKRPVRASFDDPTTTHRRKRGGGKGQLIARAVGLRGARRPRVLDATAGLGADAFTLAALGCEVVLVERVGVIHSLLADGLERARQTAGAWGDAELSAAIGRMTAVCADARQYLAELGEEALPDVVYLDPMFPKRRKSAAVRKEMEVFRDLVGGDEDAGALLAAALERDICRAVVKRHRLAPVLAGPEPDHVLEGRRSRYDIYVKRALPERQGAGGI